MEKIVLLIEDLPDEQEKAKKALADHGFRVVITSTLADALRIWKSLGNKFSGVITDLHFPETSNNPKAADCDKPCGLSIVAEATRKGMPVVVCSNIDHHFCKYVEIVIRTFEQFHPLKKIPFIMDSKDWNEAANQLNRLIKGEE